ncbi:MAG: AAA family ATPase, partial [Crocinitomicaceae bacterium]|nr:AAA family ATPase [Crocinitomicaceae bacterium]
SKLETSFFEEVDAELIYLSDYFGISKIQSLIIALTFVKNYKGDSLDFRDLIKYFDCNPMVLLKYSDNFNELCDKRILDKKKSRHSINLTYSNDQFTINERVTNAVLNNEPMPTIELEGSNDVLSVFENIFNLVDDCGRNELNSRYVFNQTNKLIEANLHFPLIKKIADFKLEIEDTYFYCYLIWKTLTGKEKTDIGVTAENIFDRAIDRVNYIQEIMFEENELVIRKLIEVEEARFSNDSEVKLSEISLNLLEENGLKLFAKKKKKEGVISPENIDEKELFFNEFEANQLDMLKRLLHEDKFQETQNRLKEKSLPKGVTVLLHGSPGTGKTETVYQVAKASNREIVKVDISKSKSMWFGESEKIIKRIFTDYKSYAKTCEQMPILLFNEADAIISKRKEGNSSNIDQTENAIQNIILEELENFEGIFFATTNLVSNLDLAFERRFLFKVEFLKPEISIKAKIWKSKLPSLSETECEELASQFDFSGGQIDNIVRKNEIHEVIHGLKVEFKSIIDFCTTELLAKASFTKIGFVKE